MKYTILLFPLLLLGCSDPEYVSVTFAMEHEGCRVYRIKDKDREEYFAKCTCEPLETYVPTVPAVKGNAK